MKKLVVLLFAILISFNSWGEWEEIGVDTSGTTYYIDTDTIKENGGYVYYWALNDYLKPKAGYMSTKMYKQGDCGVNRYKILSFIWYEQPMGEGDGERDNPPNEWRYPLPKSVSGYELGWVCDYID